MVKHLLIYNYYIVLSYNKFINYHKSMEIIVINDLTFDLLLIKKMKNISPMNRTPMTTLMPVMASVATL